MTPVPSQCTFQMSEGRREGRKALVVGHVAREEIQVDREKTELTFVRDAQYGLKITGVMT